MSEKEHTGCAIDVPEFSHGDSCCAVPVTQRIDVFRLRLNPRFTQEQKISLTQNLHDLLGCESVQLTSHFGLAFDVHRIEMLLGRAYEQSTRDDGPIRE